MRTKKGYRTNKRIREPFGKRAGRGLRRVLRPVLAATVIVAVVWGGVWSYRRLLAWPYLTIRTINVTGTERVRPDAAAAMTGLKGKNILSFRAKDVIAVLKSDPWIEGATVTRSFPDAVDIAIRERHPVALVKMDGMYVMDGNGVIFKKLSDGDNLDLPVVTGLTMDSLASGKGAGWGLLELLKTLGARPGFNLSKVSEIHFDPTFGFSIYTLAEGVRLDVGMDAFAEKLASFEKVLSARDGTLNGIESMDLNNSHQVVVRFTSDVIKEGGDRHGKKG